jgi:hypothetical protein
VVALIAARSARPRRRRRAGAVAALTLAAVLVPVTIGGCGGSCDPRRGRDAGVHGEGDAGAADAGVPSRVMIDLVERLATCDVEHRGLLIDAGTEQLMGRLGWQWTIPAGLAVTEHDGATWTKAFDRSIELSFTLSETTPIFVAARAQGAASRAAAVLLDDQPLGTLTFARDQIRIATTPTTHLPVDRGAHTLTIRFSGRGKAEAEPWAELDWIRIGIPDEDQTTYGAPTLRDLVAPAAALGGIPHRAIALRAPGSVRCAMRPPKNGRVRVALGLQGAGEADADLRYLRDGAPPVVIGKVHLTGGERARWTDVELPLPPETGEVGALELRALTAPRSARILFGDPAITLPATDPPAAPAARAVVVVVLDGVERADLPPWSGPRSPLGTISDIALTGTAFERHRAPSTIVSPRCSPGCPRAVTASRTGARACRSRCPTSAASLVTPACARRCSPACRPRSKPSGSRTAGRSSWSTRRSPGRHRRRPSTTPPRGSPRWRARRAEHASWRWCTPAARTRRGRSPPRSWLRSRRPITPA